MLRLRKILLCDFLYYFLLLLVGIYLIIFFSNYKLDHIYNENDNYFELKIKKYKIDGDKLTIEFNNLIGSYYFKTSEEKQIFINNYSINDLLSVKGTLIKPNNNTIPNTFNYKKYLSHKNIEYILQIKEYTLKKKNRNLFYKIKNYLYKRINNISNKEYLYAFILGESSYIDESVYNNYKINGITHLFALSGLHISIFSSILLFILKKLKIQEIPSFIITSLFLLFFSFIASFTPSILRATIFFILSSINKIWYFFIKPKYLLFLTFIILVLINPNYIFYTSFILSFTITFFILLYNENNNKSSIIKISIISFLSSAPIIINMSYEINIIGFINNLFFIPYVSSVVFPLSLLTIIFTKLSSLLSIFLRLMESVSLLSSKILNITLFFPKIEFIELLLYYVFLILIIKKKRVIKIFFIILIVFLYSKPIINNNTSIYFLDVNQGDSTLIVTNKNKSILIDSGGKMNYDVEEWKKRNKEFNLMKDSLIPFYKSIGLKRINYSFFSHGDYDHIGYSKELISNFKVDNIYINNDNVNYYEKEINGIKYNNKYLRIDNVEIYPLNDRLYDNENDNSLVLLIIIDGYKLLFMGDASSKVENDLVEKYNLKNIDILKVGHHGSNTSSGINFIKTINPKYSIISVGKNNKYGHPNKEVLENLKESKIYRTDEDGSIMFKIKNNELKIEICSP